MAAPAAASSLGKPTCHTSWSLLLRQHSRPAPCCLRVAPHEALNLVSEGGPEPPNTRKPPLVQVGGASGSLCEGSDWNGQAKQASPFEVRTLPRWRRAGRTGEDDGQNYRSQQDGGPQNAVSSSKLLGSESSLRMYRRLVQECCVTRNIREARRVHDRIQSDGLETSSELGSAVVDMFLKCDSLEEAHGAFDRLPQPTEMCWTGLISAYAKCGEGKVALKLYEQMQDAGVLSTSFTYTAVLKACAVLNDLEYGKRIHREVISRGLETDPYIGPAVVGMYAKSGNLAEAYEVFNRCPQGNIFLWNTLIKGLADSGYGKEALELYGRLKQRHMEPSRHTYVHVLRACSSVGALEEARAVHSDVRHSGLHVDPYVASALVDTYAEWGQLEDARQAFDALPSQTVGVWNRLIRAYGNNDKPKMALQCFADMQKLGVKPDGQTFSALLVTCSHQGLVQEGQRFFDVMEEEHGISPTLHHYTCMADVLCRSGLVYEAESLLENMPYEATVVGWTSLLSACSRFVEVELGRRCFERIVKVQPGNASAYLLMSRLYSSAGLKVEADRIERMRRSAGARNYPASVLIQVNSQLHEFLSGKGSKNHPMFRELQEKIKSVTENMRRQGFDVGDSPAYSAPLNPPSELSEADMAAVDEFNKAAGPIMGRSRRSQNRLRMCASCHQWVKVLSFTEKRQVIMRDGYRTHHFKDGKCSCGDRDYGTILEMAHDKCSMNGKYSFSYQTTE